MNALDSRYSWFRLAITLTIAIVGNAGIWIVVVVLPVVQAEFGIARADASLPYTLTMAGFAVGNLVIGRAVDRYGISVSLIGGTISVASGFALAALSGSVPVMTASHLLIGFGTAACFGPLIADISHWFVRHRGIAVAITASGNYLSGVIWPVALSGTLAELGWRAVYWALAAICILIVVPLAFALRRRVPEEAKAAADEIARFRTGSIGLSPGTICILLAIAGVGCCVAMSMPQVHIVALCVDLGYGPAVGAEMLSLMLLGGVVSRVASGLIADRLGGVKTLLIGSGLQCAALFLYLPFDGMVSLYVVSAIFGLSQGGIVPSYAIIVREYLPAGQAGRRVGFVIMVTILGMALGGWMSGWIYDLTGSYRWAFMNGIAWNFLNLGIIAFFLFATDLRRPRLA